MADTPKSAFPVISDQATVRIKLGLLVSAIVAIIGGTVWLTNLANNQARIEGKVDDVRDRITTIERMFGMRQPVGAVEAEKGHNP